MIEGGFSPIPDWIMDKADLSFGAKCLYGLILRLRGKNTIAYPRYEAIARMLGISERQVARYMKELEDAWLLHIVLHFPDVNEDGSFDEATFRANDYIPMQGKPGSFMTRERQREAHRQTARTKALQAKTAIAS